MSEEFDEVARLIEKAGRIVALTGAGISTESGIPDFRSPGGLWTRYDPMVYGTYESFLNDPSKFWEMAAELNPTLEQAEPNPAHLALAELERMGKCEAVITQNIDNLHQRAGSSLVLELHGTYRTGTCLQCDCRHSYEEIREAAVTGTIPTCSECGGPVKPDVVLFGEPLNAPVLQRAIEYATTCDLMLVIGCSLEVVPAATLPIYANRNNSSLVFVNMASMAYEEIADIIIKGLAGQTMPGIVQSYREMVGAPNVNSEEG